MFIYISPLATEKADIICMLFNAKFSQIFWSLNN